MIQSKQKNWIGSTTLEIQYIDNINLKKKKDKLYDRYNMLPIEKNHRTLRFKAKGMYLQNIEELLEMDSEINFINGEAEDRKRSISFNSLSISTKIRFINK